MARRLSAEWRAEWRERLVRFRGWRGTSGEFCRREGISRSSLLRWAKRLRVPVTARSRPGTGLVRVRAQPEADRPPSLKCTSGQYLGPTRPEPAHTPLVTTIFRSNPLAGFGAPLSGRF
jgi:hypothetical protein